MNSIPQIPEEIRAARIGTCYNAFTRKLMHTRNAIDPKKIEDGTVLFIPGTAELSLRANSSSTKNVQESFFALDSKAKIGPWATASYNMSLASSEANAASSLSCYCSYVYKDQKLQLMDQGPESLFNCMTDEFQKAYTELVTADKEQVLDKYLAFVSRFGYGCVTGLHLSSGSAFEIQARHASSAKTWEDKYNSSVGIGFSFGGASVAVSYAQKGASADSSATVEITAVNYPENTPTRDWCNQYMTTLAGIAFKDLAEKAQTISAYAGDAPKAPDIPEGKKDEKALPDKKMADVVDEMQRQLMKMDGFGGTWEEYLKEQEKVKETIKPEKVAEEASNRLEESLAYDLGSLPAEEAPDLAVSASAWDLGGYVPHHVDCTAWSELFPALADLQLPTGLHTLYLGKAYIYYMTRLQYASYLNLLIDRGFAAQDGRPEADRDACVAVCKKLLDKIDSYLRAGTVFNQEIYDRLVAFFEQELLKNWPDFNGHFLYKVFFRDYGFFYWNMSGFAVVKKDAKGNFSYIDKTGKSQTLRGESWITLELLMRDGLRTYPIFQGSKDDGIIHMDGYFPVSSGEKKEWQLLCSRPMPTASERKSDGRHLAYYEVDDDKRIYSADEKALRSLEGVPMAALPMLPPLNFDDIYSFLGMEG